MRENLLFCNLPLKLTRPDHAAAVADIVRQTGAEVVAVDPLYRYHTGDENSVRDLGLAFDPPVASWINDTEGVRAIWRG